ncbi:hypothetical protein HYN59_17375 [Flavobacterium album]|uniref:Lipocalin-like domain-containing protein n=1 Tax=Flavobacterium album TaxID=2175091 RepID=A0A2S1R2D4_9FLAO|nr:hypothetical protein [Flavobacterium album]AWH86772.1 hypothetical protein HYN59_17375 [Flavobacterium album]
MKKLLLLLLVLVSQQTICQEIEINEKNLSKKWVFSDVINDKSEAENAEMREMLEGTSLTFREDKTYTFDFVSELNGTWTLDPAKKEITTKDRRGTNIWHIHSLTKEKAVLSRNDAQQKVIFKPE